MWSDSPENVVASYKDQNLTTQEIKAILPENVSIDDSIKLTKKYTEDWLKDKVFFEQVKDSLNESQVLAIEEKVEKYREDLILRSVEEILYKKLEEDSIKNTEIENYYDENKSSFVSNEDWVEYKYLRIPKDSVEVYRSMFNSELPEKQKELENRVNTYDYAHQLQDNVWGKFETLKNTAPFPSISNNKEFLQRTKNITLYDGNNVYLVKLLNFRAKGENLPLPVVKGTIKNVLVNKRKLNLLSQYKNELYENALQNGDIEKK